MTRSEKIAQRMASIEVTRLGFIYGEVAVERISNDKRGVWIAVISKREIMEIRVTPGGRISVYDHNKIFRKSGGIS